MKISKLGTPYSFVKCSFFKGICIKNWNNYLQNFKYRIESNGSRWVCYCQWEPKTVENLFDFCIIFHLFVNTMQEKIAMTPQTKCVETIVIFFAAAIIVLTNKEMFFEKEHIGNILEYKEERKIEISVTK